MPDILIRGMEMPTDSPVYLAVCPSGGVYVHAYERGYGALVKSQYRVVELPEHGDLIERNPLVKLFNSRETDEHWGWLDEEDLLNAPVIVPSNKEESE